MEINVCLLKKMADMHLLQRYANGNSKETRSSWTHSALAAKYPVTV
jgi:hypothetical protein